MSHFVEVLPPCTCLLALVLSNLRGKARGSVMQVHILSAKVTKRRRFFSWSLFEFLILLKYSFDYFLIFWSLSTCGSIFFSYQHTHVFRIFWATILATTTKVWRVCFYLSCSRHMFISSYHLTHTSLVITYCVHRQFDEHIFDVDLLKIRAQPSCC